MGEKKTLETGYYWVRCQLNDCDYKKLAEIAYYDGLEPEMPWQTVFCDQRSESGTFEVIARIIPPERN